MNKLFLKVFWSLFLLALLNFAAHAQEKNSPETAPPPVVALSENERIKINEASVKKRLQVILDFAEVRLKASEALTEKNDFAGASAEFGGFRALNREAVKFLAAQGKTGKARDFARTFELTLRRQITRIETIRRSTPYEYSVHIGSLLDYVRDLRSKALDSFFDDTVLKEN